VDASTNYTTTLGDGPCPPAIPPVALSSPVSGRHPIGNTAKAYWEGLLAGVSGVGPITQFDPSELDVRIAAEVKDFDPASPWTVRWPAA